MIIEAGLTGIPAIGSDRGGIEEAIDGGGVVVSGSDVRSWARAIETVSGPAWHDLSRRARTRSSRLVRGCVAELAAAGVIAAT